MKKEEILKKLDPAINKFADELLKIQKDMEGEAQVIEQEKLNVEDIKKDLKAQQDKNTETLQIAKNEFKEKTDKLNATYKKLEKEIADISSSKSEVLKTKKKAEQELETAKVERKMASDTLAKAEKKKKDLETKMNLLKNDEVKIENKKKELNAKESALNKKEDILGKKEFELNEKENTLAEREVILNSREKNIKNEITRLKLKKK